MGSIRSKMMTRRHTRLRGILLFCLLTAVLPACEEKKQLERDVESKQAVLAERRAELAQLQNTYNSMPTEKKYTAARPNQAKPLRERITSVEGEIATLEASKKRLQEQYTEEERKISEYLRRYSNP